MYVSSRLGARSLGSRPAPHLCSPKIIPMKGAWAHRHTADARSGVESSYIYIILASILLCQKVRKLSKISRHLLKGHRNSPKGASVGLRGRNRSTKKDHDNKWRCFEHIYVLQFLVLKYTHWSHWRLLGHQPRILKIDKGKKIKHSSRITFANSISG